MAVGKRRKEGGILLRRSPFLAFLFFTLNFPSIRGTRGISIRFYPSFGGRLRRKRGRERGKEGVEKEGK